MTRGRGGRPPRITRTGDWALAEQLLRSLPQDFKHAVEVAVHEEAKEFEVTVRKVFHSRGREIGASWPAYGTYKVRRGRPSATRAGINILPRMLMTKRLNAKSSLVTFKQRAAGVGAANINELARAHEFGKAFTENPRDLDRTYQELIPPEIGNPIYQSDWSKHVPVFRVPARSFFAATKASKYPPKKARSGFGKRVLEHLGVKYINRVRTRGL